MEEEFFDITNDRFVKIYPFPLYPDELPKFPEESIDYY